MVPQVFTQRVLLPLLGEMGTGILVVAVILAMIVLFLGMDAIQSAALRTVDLARGLGRRLRERKANELGRVLSSKQAPSAPERAAGEALLRLPSESGARSAAPPTRRSREETLPAPSLPQRPAPAVPEASPSEKAPLAEKSGPEPTKSRSKSEAKPTPVPPIELKSPPRPAPVSTLYKLPTLDILEKVSPSEERAIKGDVETTARILRETLADFGIEVTVENIESGPVVTRYELLPAAGVRVERIAALSNNLALSLKATSVRVQAPIPGKGLVGVEVPNSTASIVYLREILESSAWQDGGCELPLVLGQDVSGKDLVADLTSMPHLLIAGATGSGKTVCMNSILAGLFMARTPDELRLLLIDPKIVEFAIYNHMPHLEAPVITNPKKVAIGLQWAIKEMENRYKMFAKAGVRNIKTYNAKLVEKQGELFPGIAAAESQPEAKPLPYIVIIVDELADLMLTAQADIENAIARLAQLSRAVGIHMILATQRPSVNVITGTIKANFPARIAFQVAQKVDSRTILDANGADKLLGRGDMLFLPPGSSKLVRAQGAMTTDGDLRRIVEYWKMQAPAVAAPGLAETAGSRPATQDSTRTPSPAAVAEEPAPSLSEMMESGHLDQDNSDDAELIEAALQIIRETHRASTSSLQRRLRIGYTRAARVMDALEARGIVGPARGADPREILIDLDGEIPDNRPLRMDAKEENNG
jgi:S-DNA-T family DNA segregation ATPase FtsK/SpoIIIE